jgi:hypothetical protein
MRDETMISCDFCGHSRNIDESDTVEYYRSLGWKIEGDDVLCPCGKSEIDLYDGVVPMLCQTCNCNVQAPKSTWSR